ncbi:hypothetical protein [Burkholderia sp. Bp8998]|nr:hypothetical protein [Burkholderia sp. Bp8998]
MASLQKQVDERQTDRAGQSITPFFAAIVATRGMYAFSSLHG